MPHANIYIRRHNEERWNRKDDKSVWVNHQLDKEAEIEKREPVWLEKEQRWSDAT